MSVDASLPTMVDLLAPVCQAEVARRIGKPRAFVWRLARGGRLTDVSVISALACVLHQDESRLVAIIRNDTLRINLRAGRAGRNGAAIRALAS